MTGSFTVDAFIDRYPSRNRHFRDRDHSEDEWTESVALERAIGRYPAGTDIFTVLEDLYLRLQVVRGAQTGSFTADAVIS